MPTKYEKPTIREVSKPGGAETIETHPAYAQIAASRVSGGASLYGSEFRHQHFVTVTIRRSELHRDLSRDWAFGKDELIAVAMSEAQWATFVSSMNCGMGVQCTLEHVGMHSVPQLPDPVQRNAEFTKELGERLDIVKERLDTLAERIEATGLSGKAKKELLGLVQAAQLNLGSNLNFVAKSFAEYVEGVTERAKVEINAYTQSMLLRAGAKTLKTGDSPLQLGDGKDEG